MQIANSYIKYTIDGSIPSKVSGLIYDTNNKPILS